MLAETTPDPTSVISDSTESRSDIISLLMRAQASSEASGDNGGRFLDKENMVEHVVCYFLQLRSAIGFNITSKQLTFLGTGHETTASGIAWVSWSPKFSFHLHN